MNTNKKFVDQAGSSNRSSGLVLTVGGSVGKSYSGLLRQLIPRAAGILSSPLRELSFIFVNDAAMGELHEQFMGDPATTDVMTFPLEFDGRERAISGEVYICIPEARRQAKLRGTSPEREVLLYALHGLLHLNGFDDRTDRDYRRMHRREDQILIQLGVGPIFAPVAQKSRPSA